MEDQSIKPGPLDSQNFHVTTHLGWALIYQRISFSKANFAYPLLTNIARVVYYCCKTKLEKLLETINYFQIAAIIVKNGN